YYYRWRATQDKDEKTLIQAKICQIESSLFCRILNSQTEKIDFKSIRSQTALVALLNLKAENSDFQSALEVYDSLKKYRSLSHALKVWDVGLFLKLEKTLKSQRSPASEDFKKRLEEFKTERVID
ncbi:MAG: hypothetical protein ACK5V3_06290, partial [Bdellovibrionales bacterium]